MQAHRTEVTVLEDGILTLHDVPFRKGDAVEVIVLPAHKSAPTHSLRGKPVTLIKPTEPVADSEWEANR